MPFFIGEIIEQLPDAGVLGSLRGFFVETTRFQLDGASLPAYCVEAERPNQPHWFALHETTHILAANQRDVLAEFFAIQFDQAAPVA